MIAQSNRRDVTECENCKIKDFRIKELEDVVRKITQLTPANQIAEEKDNKIMQLQKELDKRTQELADSSDAVNHPHDEANQNGFYEEGKRNTVLLRTHIPTGTPTNEACPGGSISYCSGYTAGYDSEWATLKQAQP